MTIYYRVLRPKSIKQSMDEYFFGTHPQVNFSIEIFYGHDTMFTVVSIYNVNKAFSRMLLIN